MATSPRTAAAEDAASNEVRPLLPLQLHQLQAALDPAIPIGALATGTGEPAIRIHSRTTPRRDLSGS